MRNRGELSRQYSASCMNAVRRVVGRQLKDQYDLAQPLPDDLAHLLSELDKIMRETPEAEPRGLHEVSTGAAGGS
jgi:hypothetical protein